LKSVGKQLAQQQTLKNLSKHAEKKKKPHKKNKTTTGNEKEPETKKEFTPRNARKNVSLVKNHVQMKKKNKKADTFPRKRR